MLAVGCEGLFVAGGGVGESLVGVVDAVVGVEVAGVEVEGVAGVVEVFVDGAPGVRLDVIVGCVLVATVAVGAVGLVGLVG